MTTETTTIRIANPHPSNPIMSRRHLANIIDYCVDVSRDELASWGSELSLLFSNGTATAGEACQYFIDALNDGIDIDDGFYALDRNNNLTLTKEEA